MDSTHALLGNITNVSLMHTQFNTKCRPNRTISLVPNHDETHNECYSIGLFSSISKSSNIREKKNVP